jgi:hypothetical protein
VGDTLRLSRNGAVGFIDWLDATLANLASRGGELGLVEALLQ